MTNQGNPYTAGYEAAYQELYQILHDEEHHRACGHCRPCGVMKEVAEVLMETLAGRMSQDEFYSLAILLTRTHTRVRDKNGNTRIDFWGELNNAVNPDGSYDWPEGGRDEL